MIRRWLAVGVTMMLGATAGCAATSPGAAERTVPSNAVLSGVVTADGAPVEGLVVIVSAWPNDDVLAGMDEGEAVEVVELARATTDRDGWFVVALDPADVGPDHTGAHGNVDLDIMFQQGLLYSFTATPAGSGTGGTWSSAHFDDSEFESRAAAGKAPMHVLVEIGDEPELREEGSDLVFWR